MSQSGLLKLSTNNIPGFIPTTFTSDNGSTSTPSAHNENIFSSFVGTNSTNGIQTRASGNTVTIQLTNRVQGFGSTVDVTTSDLIPFSLSAFPATYVFQFSIVGRETTTGDCFSAIVTCSAKTDGITSTIIQTPYTDIKTSASLSGVSITFTASLNTVNLNVTGVLGASITYNAVGSYITI